MPSLTLPTFASPAAPVAKVAELPAAALRGAFAIGARLRHARVFHPDGLELAGRLHAEPEFEALFGSGERAVIARLSKGTGTPSGWPDILGLAFRVLDHDDKPWDFALATTGESLVGRLLVTLTRGWGSARYGSLVPYRFGNSNPIWIFAEPDPDQPESASIADLAEHLRDNLATFRLYASGLRVPKQHIATLTLRLAEPAEQRTDYFDPMLNAPQNVVMVPKAVGKIREIAYTGSRRGRGEGV